MASFDFENLRPDLSGGVLNGGAVVGLKGRPNILHAAQHEAHFREEIRTGLPERFIGAETPLKVRFQILRQRGARLRLHEITGHGQQQSNGD